MQIVRNIRISRQRVPQMRGEITEGTIGEFKFGVMKEREREEVVR